MVLDSVLKEAINVINVSKENVFFHSSGSNGYQMKFVKDDLFLKASAIIRHKEVKDHLVEKIASDIAEDLDIPCVRQDICIIDYDGLIMNGVKSKNFNKEGIEYVPFRSFLDFNRKSFIEEQMIKCSTVNKIALCSQVVSDCCEITKEEYNKYLIECAIIDCLVGNVDRHLKNFGLFVKGDKYSVPLIFDNGMGMFENDPYKDSYKTLDDAYCYLYINPYGEDPFDMIDILLSEYDLKRYDFTKIKEPKEFPSDLAKIYFDKMLNYILRRY